MRLWASAALVLLAASSIIAATPAAPAGGGATSTAPAPLNSGWVLLKEGEAEGIIEADAKHPTNTNPHILKISVTKYINEPGKGRIGAKNTATIPVKENTYYDITFNGTRDTVAGANYGNGLVVSFETPDGKVIARTTLPEIGRGGGRRGGAPGGGGGGGGEGRGGAGAGGGATQPAAGGSPWRPYLVSLHARASAPAVHLTITPIEPMPVWLENITITERK